MATERGPRITFTDEQQAHLQELLNRNYVRVHKKLTAEYEAEVGKLKAEIEELKNKKKGWSLFGGRK